MRCFTGSLSSPLVIEKDDGVFKMSVLASGGTVNILGNFPFKGLSPSVISLADGQGVVLESTTGVGIDGFTISPGSGSADTIIFFT